MDKATLNLVVVSEEFSGKVSGGAHVRHRFCELADEWGHDLVVLTSRRKGEPRRETVGDIDVVRLVPAPPESTPALNVVTLLYRVLFSLSVFLYLLWWLPSYRPDGIHSASSAAHWAARIAGFLFGVPVVNFLGITQSSTSTDPGKVAALLEWVNFGFFLGDAVLCRTPATKRLVETHSNGTVEIIHGILHGEHLEEAISANDSQPILRYASGDADHVLVYVGRLVDIKNPVGAVRLIEELPGSFELLIVGDGPQRDRVDEAAAGSDATVTVLGQLPHPETLEVIRSADGLVLTSHAEAYPSVVFEALALGTPAFVTPVGIVQKMQHENLYAAPLSELSEKIRSHEFHQADPDPDLLQRYSIEQYTATILKTHADLLESTLWT